jgi:hypothetical protein
MKHGGLFRLSNSNFPFNGGLKLKCGALGLLALGAGGCTGLRPDQGDVAIVMDGSLSTLGDDKVAQTLEGVGRVYLARRRVGPRHAVLVRHGGNASEVIEDRQGHGLALLRQKLGAIVDISPPQARQALSPAAQEEAWALFARARRERATGQRTHQARDHVPILRDPRRMTHGSSVSSDRMLNSGGGDEWEMGSPVVETLLAPALRWANARPSSRRVTIVVVSDLIADPAAYRDGCARWPRDPALFRWALKHPRQVRLRVYMTPPLTADHLRRAWLAQAPGLDVRFFDPGHLPAKEDLEPQDPEPQAPAAKGSPSSHPEVPDSHEHASGSRHSPGS